MSLDLLRLWWYSKPAYWRLRDRLGRAMFGVRRRAFSTRRAFDSTKEKTSIGLSIVRASVSRAILAVALVAFFEGLAAIGSHYAILPSLAGDADRDVYHGLALTIVSIGGTLLGLYFTALTVVLSGVYVDVTPDVRRLLVFDRAGNLYSGLLTVMVIASLSVVGMDLIGFTPASVTVLALTVVAGLASVSLLLLGARAFGFFDPASLGSVLRHDFNRWVREASSRGLGSTDISFQTHYQRRAEVTLNTLASLAEVVIARSTHDSESLVKIGSHLLDTWFDYSASKSAVPLDSRWYRRRYQHREWLVASDSATGIALQTGTYLPPDEVGEELWVEMDLAKALRRVCASIAECRDTDTTGRFLLRLNNLLETLGQRLQIEEARLLWSIAANSFLPDIESVPGTSPEEIEWAMVSMDLLALVPISIVVGIAQHVGSFDSAYIVQRVEGAVLSGKKRTGRGPAALDLRLDWLREGIDFELAVEGRRVTPSWWLEEKAAQALIEFCCAMLPGVIEDYTSMISDHENASKASVKLDAIARFRALELLEKLGVHAETIQIACDSLSSARKLTSDPWPDPQLDELKARIAALHRGAVRAIALIAPKLGAECDRAGHEPDFFGRAQALLVAEVFQATLRGDSAEIEVLLPSAFLSALQAYEKLRERVDPEAEPHLVQEQILLMTEPLADLLELSGYGLLTAEVGHPEVWASFENLWTAYLGKNEGIVDVVFRAMSLRESTFGMFPRDVARTGREMEFWHAMVGDAAADIRNGYWRTRQRHESALVEITLRSSGMHKPGTAFASQYLAPRHKTDTDLPDAVRRFQEHLDQETQRKEGE